MDNTSGQGKDSAVPEEVKGISWGAFWWTFIWGIFNRVWFSFLIFVPVVGFFAWLILLFKGRQWAWQKKHWDSVEHFNRVQRLWGLSGLIVVGLFAALSVGGILVGGLLGDEPPKPATVAKAASAATSAPKPAAKPGPPVMQPPAPPATAPAVPQPTSEPAVALAPKPPAPVAASAVKSAPAKSAQRPEAAAPEASRAAAMVRTVTMETPPVFPAGPAVNPSFNDLMTAVLYRDAGGVKELLALGKWPDKPDSRGTTPLMAAVMLGDAVNAEALLKAGADPNLGTRAGSTAASLARERSDGAMTALLRRYGAR